MSRKNLGKIGFLIFLVISVFLLFCLLDFISILKLKNFAKSLSFPNDLPIMQVIFYGKSEDLGMNTLSARISILDSSGNDVSVIERSWKNDGIEIFFKKTDFSGFSFYFPKHIYGKNYDSFTNSWKIESGGTNLIPYYMENKKCLLYNPIEKNKLSEELFKTADFSLNRFSVFSNKYTSDVVIDLSKCEHGKVYSIVINKSGNLVLK